MDNITPRWFTLGFSGTCKRYCGLSDQTVLRAVRTGRVRSYIVRCGGHKSGRRVIDRESLDAWIEGRDPEEAINIASTSPLLWSSRMLAKRWSMGERDVLRIYQSGAITAEISEPDLYRFDVEKVEAQLKARAESGLAQGVELKVQSR